MSMAAAKISETIMHHRGVDDVLRFAHKWEAASLIKSPSVQRSSRSSSPDAFTPLDCVADAAMILSLVRRTLAANDLFVVRMFYIVPATPELKKRKEELTVDVAERLTREIRRPKWWIADVLREWSGVKPDHDYKYWARNLSVSQATLYRWARGRNKDSIYTTVEADMQRATDALYDAMLEVKLL